MTLLAGNGSVDANQREVRHVMIESDLFAPSRRSMTAFALLAFLAIVRVVQIVATVTVGGQLAIVEVGEVTGIAGSVNVFAMQGEFCIGLMIKFCCVPAGIFVAGLAA